MVSEGLAPRAVPLMLVRELRLLRVPLSQKQRLMPKR